MHTTMPAREREKIQYLSLESMKANLHKVFGHASDSFAELLFRFLAGFKGGD